MELPSNKINLIKQDRRLAYYITGDLYKLHFLTKAEVSVLRWCQLSETEGRTSESHTLKVRANIGITLLGDHNALF